MSQMPKIQPPFAIEFGKTLLASEVECFSAYAVNVFDDTRLVDKSLPFADRHIIYSLLLALQATFDQITLPVLSDSGKATFATLLRNITRLARMKLEGDAKIAILNKLADELKLHTDGTILDDTDELYEYGIIAQIASMVVGTGLEGLVGNWDNQKYVVQDEIIGGIFIVTFFILFPYNLHVSSWNMLIHSIGDFSREPGLRGNFRPLVPSDEKTWGSLLVKQENAQGIDIFGINTLMLDDPQLRAVSVVKIEGIEKLISKLLTSSQWTWRFGRWMRVQPVYFMSNPKITGRGPFDSCQFDEFGTTEELFSNHTSGNQWRTFNNDLLEFISDLKSFYFKNKSYGNLKALFTIVAFEDFPQPGPFGVGGLAFHTQNTVIDPLIGRTLAANKYYKEIFDKLTQIPALSINKCMGTYRNYREYNNDNRFMIVGDMEPEDVLLSLSFFPTYVDDMAGGVNSFASEGFRFVHPIAYFGFGIGKTEEQPYKIGRTVYDCMATSTVPATLANDVVSMIGHGATYNGIVPTWSAYISTDDVHFPVSAERPYPLFKYGRGLDPYKKLKHTTIDANQLDFEYIQKVAQKYFIPVATMSSIPTSPIPVSAIVEPPSNQTLVSDDVNSKKEMTATPLPVSAVPAKVEEKKKDEKNAK